MPIPRAVLSMLLPVLACSALSAQTATDRPAARPTQCPYVGVPYLTYWKCQTTLRRGIVVHAISRRDLPHDALHITMRTGKVWVSSGPTDSIFWYGSSSGHLVDTQGLPDDMFHAGAAGNGYEMRFNVPDSFPDLRATSLEIFVPNDLKTLQVDVGAGGVLVSSLSGEVTITVEKGSVDASALTGPALIEDRDGPIKINLTKLRFGQESLLKSSLNVLGRNGDIDLTLPQTTRANLSVEAHQGAIVDSPFGLTTRKGDGDTIPVQLRPVLGLRDNELRAFQRVLNGGGPDVKIVALNGNVTVREYVATQEQGPAAVPLKPADAILARHVRSINYVRELVDGRVLVGISNGLAVADFTTGKVQAIGGEIDSAAPNYEARMPYTLGGDESMTVNTYVSQWFVLDGARIVRQLAPSEPIVRATANTRFVGFDGRGHGVIIETEMNGSVRYVVRVSMATGAKDTVTRLKDLPRGADGRSIASDPLFGDIEVEHAAAGPDGWIAVVRADPYRVDWLSPDGKWTLGAPIPTVPVPLDDREKMVYMLHHQITNPQRDTGDSAQRIRLLRSPDWPAVVPAFVGVVLDHMLAPNGEIAISRPVTADHPETRYDVVNRRGERVRTVFMSANETIVGFGAQSVYVKVKATDGTMSLQRHPWP